MVYRPTARVLAVLELLQVHGQMTGADLAQRLEVDRRTIRKYIETLRDLGVPIQATRGRAGAYRLRSGSRLPPLMFSDDEAVALTLGLLIARQSGLADERHLPAVLRKIERVLPEKTRLRVQAVAEQADLGVAPQKPVPSLRTVSTLATAARSGQRVTLDYDAGRCDRTERDFDCYGVAFCDGAWYAIGHCHLRNAQRLFRIDRIKVVSTSNATFTPPGNFAAMEQITAALAAVPRQWLVSVLIHAPAETTRTEIALSAGHFSEVGGDATRVRVSVGDLRWMARVLAGSGLPFAIESPRELEDAVRDYAKELVARLETSES